MKHIISLLITILVLTGCVNRISTPLQDDNKLQGKWVVTYNELKKQTTPKMYGSIFLFRNQLFSVNGGVQEKYIVDNSTLPKQINFINGDSIIRGIYKINGNTLIICTAPPREGRPKEFRTSKISGVILTKLKRN